MWIALVLCAALVILLINGLMQQERFRLWQAYQDELADKHRAEMDQQKKLAAERIKEVLRQRRAGAEVDVTSELNAAIAEARGAGPLTNDESDGSADAGRPDAAPEPAASR